MTRWPLKLVGEEIVQYLIANDDQPNIPGEDLDEEWVDETLRPMFDGCTGTLQLVALDGLVFNGGYIDRDNIDRYSALTTPPPPIIVRGKQIEDGNHRVTIARERGQTHLWAYVIERSDEP